MQGANHEVTVSDHVFAVMQTSLTGHGCLQIIGHVNSDLASEEETAATVKFVATARKVLPKVCSITDPTCVLDNFGQLAVGCQHAAVDIHCPRTCYDGNGLGALQ